MRPVLKGQGYKEDNRPSFLLDSNDILRKLVKLQYTIEPAIVVPQILTYHIIIQFHNVKGHQGISQTVNMIKHYFWVVGM